MGYAITWCAVREEAADQLLSHLGLSPTGETRETPEARFSTARMTTGWRLIWSNRNACPVLVAALNRYSETHEIVVCNIEEHVMASSAELRVGGDRKWWVSHEGEDGPRGLDTGGELPECFASIRQEMESAQREEGGDDAGVDYLFEVPLKVAQMVVGFKHDESYESVIEGGFIVLSDGKKAL